MPGKFDENASIKGEFNETASPLGRDAGSEIAQDDRSASSPSGSQEGSQMVQGDQSIPPPPRPEWAEEVDREHYNQRLADERDKAAADQQSRSEIEEERLRDTFERAARGQDGYEEDEGMSF